MKIKILLSIIILTFSKSFKCQARNTSNGKQVIYNVSIGAAVGAIGAVINKKPKQRFDKTLAKGLYQGALGGYITFESKRLIHVAEKNNDWKILWCAKIINAGGTSIKENAALNKDFWEKWHINIGFSRIEFETQDQFKVNYKVMPIALVYTIGIATQAKFELRKTLQSGEFVFTSNSNRFYETNTAAVTFPGNIVINTPEKNNFAILSHEIIHLFQANDFSQIEAYLDKPLNLLNKKYETLNGINKYIHYDFRYIPQLILYRMQEKNSTYYYDNFFEKEAAFYSNTFEPFILKIR